MTQELEQKQVENSKLREKSSQLEEKLTTATKSRQELQEVGSLRLSGMVVSSTPFVSTSVSVFVSQSVWSERVEQEGQLGALEKIITQKEMLLLATQEEKNRLEMEIKAVREENRAKLTAALAHAQKQKVFLWRKREDRLMSHHLLVSDVIYYYTNSTIC